MSCFVYIMAKRKHGTLYVGITNDLVRCVWEHKQGVVDSFTKSYDVKQLVYFEIFDDPYNAIQREKNIKLWKRAWKIQLIENENPEWNDLHSGLFGEANGPAGQARG